MCKQCLRVLHKTAGKESTNVPAKKENKKRKDQKAYFSQPLNDC